MTVPEGYLVPIGETAWSDHDRFALNQAGTMLGRGAQCDILIRLRSVSRLHAELVWNVDVLHLVQHSTTNPTVVNGMPVIDTVILHAGDVIEIGQGIVGSVVISP